MSAHDEPSREKPFRVSSALTMGAAIRYFRSGASISQTELARRTGIPRNYVSALENGHETEHLTRLLEVCRELGVRITLERLDG
jgi:transcriptional regulator with XRE-family HTH domain